MRRENQYFNAQLMILKSTDSDLLDTIALFRHYIRMRDTENIQQVISNHNVFVVANQANQSSVFSTNNQKSTFNDQSTQENDNNQNDKKKKTCLCNKVES
jgi:hypothetical protein